MKASPNERLALVTDHASYVANTIQKLSRFLSEGKISNDEFLYNALLTLLDSGSGHWHPAIRSLEPELRSQLTEFCKRELQGDFSSIAGPLLASPSVEELKAKAAACKLECAILIRDLLELSAPK